MRDNVLYPYDDALVISVPINQALVKRTLVDTRSQVDPSLIRPVKSSLIEFSQIEKIQSEGVVTLALQLGTMFYMESQVELTVVNLPMAYNVILG